MNEEAKLTSRKSQILAWVKTHRKELILAGIGIGVLLGLIIGIKNKKALEDVWCSLMGAIEKTKAPASAERALSAVPNTIVATPEVIVIDAESLSRIPHEVRSHLRYLPEGYHASPEKIATALENGFDLAESGMTWVKQYATGAAA